MSDHRTYEHLTDAMRALIERRRDEASKAQRGVFSRMLFELAAYDKIGPRPIMHRLRTGADVDPHLEMRLLDESCAMIDEWEQRAKAAGLDEDDYR